MTDERPRVNVRNLVGEQTQKKGRQMSLNWLREIRLIVSHHLKTLAASYLQNL